MLILALHVEFNIIKESMDVIQRCFGQSFLSSSEESLIYLPDCLTVEVSASGW